MWCICDICQTKSTEDVQCVCTSSPTCHHHGCVIRARAKKCEAVFVPESAVQPIGSDSCNAVLAPALSRKPREEIKLARASRSLFSFLLHEQRKQSTLPLKAFSNREPRSARCSMTTKTVCASGERLSEDLGCRPLLVLIFDNGVEGNDQLYSPVLYAHVCM